MGFIAPWVLKCKLLLQKTWSHSNNWDDPLDNAIHLEWMSLCKEVSSCPKVTVPRLVSFGSNSCLHLFSDASGLSYASCMYLVSHQKTSLLFSRNRLNPNTPTLTIPRAELLGALLSVRIAILFRSTVPELSNLPIVFWCDSTCVLGWLYKDLASLKPFVRNRV